MKTPLLTFFRTVMLVTAMTVARQPVARAGINVGNTAIYAGCYAGCPTSGAGWFGMNGNCANSGFAMRKGFGGPIGPYAPYYTGYFGGAGPIYSFPYFAPTPSWNDAYYYGVSTSTNSTTINGANALAVVPSRLHDPNPPRANLAEFTVQVPADAEVWIEGVKMSQRGPSRRFVSPTLAANVVYVYEIRAAWHENGKRVTDTQRITVRAGARATVAFLVNSTEAFAGNSAAAAQTPR